MVAKVHHALELVEQAQRLINEAACELCAVDMVFADEHRRLCRLYDTIKADWHKLNAVRIDRVVYAARGGAA